MALRVSGTGDGSPRMGRTSRRALNHAGVIDDRGDAWMWCRPSRGCPTGYVTALHSGRGGFIVIDINTFPIPPVGPAMGRDRFGGKLVPQCTQLFRNRFGAHCGG